MRRAVVLEAGFPELGRDHVLDRGDPEVFRDQRMRVDAAAQLDREPGHAHGELVALELHLAPRHVERGDELQVGRGRGVGEEGLLERTFDLREVLVPDRDHRALPEGRHRLVGRVRLVDADPHLVRIGQQAHVEQLRIVRLHVLRSDAT